MDTGTVVTVGLVLLALAAVIFIVKRLTRKDEPEVAAEPEGLFAPTSDTVASSSHVTTTVADEGEPVYLNKKYDSKVGGYYSGASRKGYETSEARKRREERQSRDDNAVPAQPLDVDGDGLPGSSHTGTAVGLGTGLLVGSHLNDEPVRTEVPLVSPDESKFVEPTFDNKMASFEPSYPTPAAPVSTPEPSGTSFSGSSGFSGSSEPSYSAPSSGSSYSSGGGSSYDSGSSGSSFSGSSDSGGSSFSSSD